MLIQVSYIKKRVLQKCMAGASSLRLYLHPLGTLSRMLRAGCQRLRKAGEILTAYVVVLGYVTLFCGYGVFKILSACERLISAYCR